jgi:prepilin-type N-terminal cleavage/methylation domain-containing protein
MNPIENRRPGFTLVELLVVISIIAIIAGLVVPVLLRGRGEAWKVQCTNNLRQMYPAANDYAAKHYSYPREKDTSDPRAHESINKLLASRFGKGLPADVFKCAAGDSELAEQEEGEKLVLDEDTLDYAWTRVKAKPDKLAALASDKYMSSEEHGGHPDVLNVLYTDSHVAEMDIDDPKYDEDEGLPKGLGR